jgi:ABC-2 type transport system ATP-binding protein
MGKTIVLSSHILPELAEMCTSYGVIHDGRMVANGPAGDILGHTGARRARARVQGDLEPAARVAEGIAGIAGVRRVGADTLQIELAGGPGDGATDAATLLGALIAAGIPVVDFREDDGGLEQLFLELTAPAPGEPVEQAG